MLSFCKHFWCLFIASLALKCCLCIKLKVTGFTYIVLIKPKCIRLKDDYELVIHCALNPFYAGGQVFPYDLFFHLELLSHLSNLLFLCLVRRPFPFTERSHAKLELTNLHLCCIAQRNTSHHWQ